MRTAARTWGQVDRLGIPLLSWICFTAVDEGHLGSELARRRSHARPTVLVLEARSMLLPGEEKIVRAHESRGGKVIEADVPPTVPPGERGTLVDGG